MTRRGRDPALPIGLGLALGLVLTALGALAVGGADLGPARLFEALWSSSSSLESETTARILWQIRLPRIVLAMALGAGMGLAGLASQTLFRNPLASPYVLGVSNGAAVGAVFAMLLLVPTFGSAAIPIASSVCGLAVASLVFGFATRAEQFGPTLLLAGIAVSAFASALTAGALFLAGERLNSLVFWLMGGLWTASWQHVLLITPVTLLALFALVLLAPALNVALAGERSAADLGVPVRQLQSALLLIISLTTALSVAVSGVIGFVGLIVPHALRLLLGADHRALVPASALGGAWLLLLADTAARRLAAPAEIPVGILTALIGAPVFLALLLRQTSGGSR